MPLEFIVRAQLETKSFYADLIMDENLSGTQRFIENTRNENKKNSVKQRVGGKQSCTYINMYICI